MTSHFHGQVERKDELERLSFLFQVSPIVALLGPRQCGKTTLSKQFIAKQKPLPPENYFDLENPRDRERLRDPMLALTKLKGLIVIDEVQKNAELFAPLRVLIDQRPLEQKYLILGSASRELLRQSSQTLAGRISYMELTPFSYTDTHNIDLLWLRGGYPRAFLAENDAVSTVWRQNFIKTYLEMDIPNLGIDIPPENLRRFWHMLAHYHCNICNASELGKSIGLTYKTIQRYIDILCGTFMVRQLQPWFENISKRQVKSPKVLFRDSGLFHTLLSISTPSELQTHPKLGASWEGFAVEELLRHHRAEPQDAYFWATQQGAELDLLLINGGKRHGFEIKHNSAPGLTKSMRIAQSDLKLDTLTVIYPGNVDYQLTDTIHVMGLENYLQAPRN